MVGDQHSSEELIYLFLHYGKSKMTMSRQT